ncbi:MAG: hypothetical protein J6R66_02845 [Clostridia bacterium]|nr:hypothetical protein [Clostridia bacterium]
MLGKLVNRHEKVAYYGVKDAEGSVTYHRMCGFTKMDTSKNPVEYTRRYIDESFEQTDVVAFSPSISFAFDRYSGDPVHEDIVSLADNEILGTDAVRSIVIVDISTKDDSGVCSAIKRDFSVMVESEGNSTDAYTLSGTMSTKGEKIFGKATLSDDSQTITFTADE